jgi:predicted RNA-binding Zn ribbon-like protein
MTLSLDLDNGIDDCLPLVMLPRFVHQVKRVTRTSSVSLVGMSTPATTAPLLGEPLPVELMNTIWAERGRLHDALGSAAESVAWLQSVVARDDRRSDDLATWLRQAPERELTRTHRDLRNLRDAARRLAARLTDDERASGQVPIDTTTALVALNEYAASAPTWPALVWPRRGKPRETRDSDAHAGSVFVAELARSTVALLAAESDGSLLACQAPGCVLYFVRRHPRREWCSTACGNRARQARHQRRHRTHSDTQSDTQGEKRPR